MSLTRHLAEIGFDPRTADEGARQAMVQGLADLLMARIAHIVPVLPVPLIATVMADAGDAALSRVELIARVQALIEALRERSVHVHVPRGDVAYALEAGLRILVMRGLVLEEDGLYRANPRERVLIAYYVNSIAHHRAAPAPALSP